MFWTAVVWGLGVSLGAAFGMMSFVVMFALWGWLSKTKAAKRTSEVAELSLAALDKRNELTLQMIEHMATISAAAEQYIEAKESR